MPGGDEYYDDFDDGILESLFIVSLAALLAFLVYYRQQRQIAQRNREQERQRTQAQEGGDHPVVQQPEDRGLFPQPGDPEFMNWAAGGIGH